MLAQERRKLILDRLHEKKSVVVAELSQQYGVSEETIRRDLDKLEKEGFATKSYGGAVINESVSIDMPFNVRKKRNIPGKKKIAELVGGMVDNGDHIILDASTARRPCGNRRHERTVRGRYCRAGASYGAVFSLHEREV